MTCEITLRVVGKLYGTIEELAKEDDLTINDELDCLVKYSKKIKGLYEKGYSIIAVKGEEVIVLKKEDLTKHL